MTNDNDEQLDTGTEDIIATEQAVVPELVVSHRCHN